MPLNLSQSQQHMRRMSKVIWFDGYAETVKDALKKGTAGLVAQEAGTDSGVVAANYAHAQKVVAPFNAGVNSLVSQLASLQTTAKSTLTAYLQNVLAPDLDLAVGASVATVGAALSAQMVTASGHVAPSGTIAMYFSNNFSISLPTDADPNIPDSYVDDDVVVA